jgi:hypothetical protein
MCEHNCLTTKIAKVAFIAASPPAFIRGLGIREKGGGKSTFMHSR